MIRRVLAGLAAVMAFTLSGVAGCTGQQNCHGHGGIRSILNNNGVLTTFCNDGSSYVS